MVVWPRPGLVFRDQPVLFDSYEEFVFWTVLRFRSLFRLSKAEASTLQGQLEDLRIKVVTPRGPLTPPKTTPPPFTSDIDLL